MALPQKWQYKDEGTREMEPCILRAAEAGDIEEALAAMKERPDCIHDTDDLGMNALQISIVSMRSDFGLFLLSNTELSSFICLHQDEQGRNAIELALMGGSPELKKAVDERISKEYGLWWELEDKKDVEVEASNPKPPKP